MKTGMVILNYNDWETVLNLLRQIQNFSVLDHIVIVDNQSTDSSFVKLKKIANKKIEVIQTPENMGYAYGNNFGIKYLQEKYHIDYIIISNPDIIVTEETLNKLMICLEKDPNIALIAPVIKQHNELLRGWKCPTFKDDLLSNINYFYKFFNKDLNYEEKYYQGQTTEVEVVSGCFLIIKSSVIQAIGYFDENTFLYYEENILGKKLKANQEKTVICNEVQVIHNLSVSIDKNYSSLKKYKILKRSQRYYQKRYNKANLWQITLLYVTFIISLTIGYINIFFRDLRRK